MVVRGNNEWVCVGAKGARAAGKLRQTFSFKFLVDLFLPEILIVCLCGYQKTMAAGGSRGQFVSQILNGLTILNGSVWALKKRGSGRKLWVFLSGTSEWVSVSAE